MTSNTDQEDQELARIPYEAMYVKGINHFKPGLYYVYQVNMFWLEKLYWKNCQLYKYSMLSRGFLYKHLK